MTTTRPVYRLQVCPVDATHGPLLGWPNDRHGFFCPHSAHGGNGRFFTTAEAEDGNPAPKPLAQEATSIGPATPQPAKG